MTAADLFVARATAVQAYAICAGVHPSAQTAFVLDVLAGADGRARGADRRLLAAARRLSETRRRDHRRAARGFRAARGAAVPVAIAREAGLGHLLGLARPLAASPQRTPQASAWVPPALVTGSGPRPAASGADWIPAGLPR